MVPTLLSLWVGPDANQFVQFRRAPFPANECAAAEATTRQLMERRQVGASMIPC